MGVSFEKGMQPPDKKMMVANEMILFIQFLGMVIVRFLRFKSALKVGAKTIRQLPIIIFSFFVYLWVGVYFFNTAR